MQSVTKEIFCQKKCVHAIVFMSCVCSGEAFEEGKFISYQAQTTHTHALTQIHIYTYVSTLALFLVALVYYSAL